MDRPDSFLLGFLSGVMFVCGVIGAAQMLVTKGYDIAVELASSGWNPRELKAHRKLAVVLPMVQRARAAGDSDR